MLYYYYNDNSCKLISAVSYKEFKFILLLI